MRKYFTNDSDFCNLESVCIFDNMEVWTIFTIGVKLLARNWGDSNETEKPAGERVRKGGNSK
jgi:hypothetical protein